MQRTMNPAAMQMPTQNQSQPGQQPTAGFNQSANAVMPPGQTSANMPMNTTQQVFCSYKYTIGFFQKYTNYNKYRNLKNNNF